MWSCLACDIYQIYALAENTQAQTKKKNNGHRFDPLLKLNDGMTYWLLKVSERLKIMTYYIFFLCRLDSEWTTPETLGGAEASCWTECSVWHFSRIKSPFGERSKGSSGQVSKKGPQTRGSENFDQKRLQRDPQCWSSKEVLQDGRECHRWNNLSGIYENKAQGQFHLYPLTVDKYVLQKKFLHVKTLQKSEDSDLNAPYVCKKCEKQFTTQRNQKEHTCQPKVHEFLYYLLSIHPICIVELTSYIIDLKLFDLCRRWNVLHVCVHSLRQTDQTTQLMSHGVHYSQLEAKHVNM